MRREKLDSANVHVLKSQVAELSYEVDDLREIVGILLGVSGVELPPPRHRRANGARDLMEEDLPSSLQTSTVA